MAASLPSITATAPERVNRGAGNPRSRARPLRILLALEAAGGGAGRHVADLASGLVARGHDVSLAYSPHRGDESFLERLRNNRDLKQHRIPMRRGLGLHDIGDVYSMRKLIKNVGPFDVVHGHSSKAGAITRIAMAGSDTPVVYTPHALITLNPSLGRPARLAYSVAERRLAKLCERVICVSEHERMHAAALGIPGAALTVIHNGIGDTAGNGRERVRAELGIAENEVCVGTVGRLSEQKAMDRLIHAYTAAVGIGSAPSRLVIVGGGPDRGPLERLARDSGVADRIIFTGSRDGVRMMAGFDVFALSSSYEGFPYVLLEAAAQGLPMIMYDTGGAGSIARDGENAWVVGQFEHAQYAERLADLIDSAPRRACFGDRSRALKADYSLDRMVDETVDLYRAVAG